MFPASTHVLVVDDTITMRMLVKKSLTELGLTNITLAEDGAKGWAKIQEAAAAGKPIELVLCDWNMPNMTGVELLKLVRENAPTANLPFVMVTAESEKSQVVQAMMLRVSAYLVKPFQTVQVKERLEAIWNATAAKKAA